MVKNKTLVLYLSNTCNLQCKYCFVQKGNVVLSLNDYIKVIEMYKHDISNITFFGGEPLLNKDLIKDIVSYNEKNNLKYSYVINTNALLIDDLDIEFYLKYEITLNISLDGNKDSNLENRCNENEFNKIIINVRNVISKGINVYINYVISPNNIKYFHESICYLKKENITKVCLLINYDALWNNKDIELFRNELLKCFDLILEGIQNKDFFIYPIFNKLNAILDGKEIKKCDFGRDTIVVSAAGKLYPCVSFVSNKDYEIKAKEDSFKNIVNIDKCKKCKYIDYCTNNCMCRYIYKNNNNSIDVNCEFEKTFIEYSYLLLKKFFDFR